MSKLRPEADSVAPTQVLARATAPPSPPPPANAPAPPPSAPPLWQADPPPPATEPGDPHRELLTQLREEREQLGRLISHPF